MTFRIIYASEYNRIIPACIIDSRKFIPDVLNKSGSVVKAFVDVEIAKIKAGVLPYKIETMDGNMVGFFSVKLDNGTADIYQRIIRPAFRSFDLEISQLIATFISSNEYIADQL